MQTIVIIGGGWAGIAAAVAAKTIYERVMLLERTDMLLGTGLVGGIMRNNGRFTAAEEAIAMGGGEIFARIDANCRHHHIDFPGHSHASLYDVTTMEPLMRALLLEKGVNLRLCARVTDVTIAEGRITEVHLANGERIQGRVFIDSGGSAGPMANCLKYGNGCAMCALRCPAFGGRVSVAALAGIPERMAAKEDGSFGAMSGSCKLLKESLSAAVRRQLDQVGIVILPIPDALRKPETELAKKACQQYALAAYAENIILLDTGHAKMMTPYFPLESLRLIPGLAHARYLDPGAGGKGNSIRLLCMCARDNTLRTNGAVDNLYCAGEKAGPLVGHTEAIITGLLAGHNAARSAMQKAPITLPISLACGDIIAYANAQMQMQSIQEKVTFSGAGYFTRMRESGLYSTDVPAIRQRVAAAGMEDVFLKA